MEGDNKMILKVKILKKVTIIYDNDESTEYISDENLKNMANKAI